MVPDLVEEFEPYSGYEWYRIEVYYDSERNLWAYDDQSGCSCNYFEASSWEEQNWKSWNDFLNDISKTLRDAYWKDEQAKAQALSDVRTLRSKYGK